LIVGNGPQKKYLEYLSKQIRIADQTIFVGKVPSKDLPQFYSACDVFVMPSVVEGFGRVLIEAMASERPIVTTKTGGVPEVATEGESAILVPIKDPKALANAIIMILKDKKLALKLAQNGRRRAVNFYSHKHVAQLYLEVFKELCMEQLGS